MKFRLGRTKFLKALGVAASIADRESTLTMLALVNSRISGVER